MTRKRALLAETPERGSLTETEIVTDGRGPINPIDGWKAMGAENEKLIALEDRDRRWRAVQSQLNQRHENQLKAERLRNMQANAKRQEGNTDWGEFDPSWQGIKNFGSNVATVGGGLLSGLRKGAHNLFNDPTRMALLQGGLTAMNPNSYYDQQGFYSTAGGLNRALSSARNAYQNVGFKEQEAIKQKNALALAKAKLTPWAMNSRGQVINTRTGEVRSPSGRAGMFLDPNQIMNQEMKMGKDFATESAVSRDQVDAYRRIEAIYSDPMAERVEIDNPTVEGGIKLTKVLDPKTGDIFDLKAGGSADLALIFNFMKMLDPASVVRESEFALAEATGDLPDWLKKEWLKVTDGGRLTADMRRNIMRQARSQYNSAENRLRQMHKDYVKRGEQYAPWGINAERALMYSPYTPIIPREAFRQPVVSVNGKNVDPNNRLGLRPPKQ